MSNYIKFERFVKTFNLFGNEVEIQEFLNSLIIKDLEIIKYKEENKDDKIVLTLLCGKKRTDITGKVIL